MTSATARANLLARDHTVVETAVPAHMLVLMLNACRDKGIEARPDVLRHLNVAAVSPLTKCDQLSVARLARRIDDVATTLLRDLNPDDPRHGLYSCAMFCMKLVDEGRFPDVRNQAVLVSMLLLDDIKDDRPDVNGLSVVWKLEEARWASEADKLISRANLMGLYLKEFVQLSALVEDA